jgi:hypothetical protein
VKTCGCSWRSRQISTLLLAPLNSSNTSRTLNSGLNSRHLDILASPFLDTFYLNAPVQF